MNPSHAAAAEDDPGIEGPDYVALVIEWGDDAVTNVSTRPLASSTSSVWSDRSVPSMMMARKIATVVGALSAIALASWGLRRLRTAS